MLKIRSLFFVLFIAFSAACSNAQVAPAVQNNDLSEQEIAEGLVWKKLTYTDLFRAKQSVNLLFVDLTKRFAKPLLFPGCAQVSKSAPKQNAIAAINGTLYRSDCTAVNLLKIDGKLTSKNTIRKNGSIALLFDKAGLPEMRITSAQEDPKLAIHAIGGFPQLIRDAKIQIDPVEKTSFYVDRHPRTAIGLVGTSQIVIMTVDGRSSHSAGFTMQELATYMQSLGVDSAMNLDGGVSTVMWIHDKGVVNKPSSATERFVANGFAIF